MASVIARRLGWQAQLCGRLGSPLYESLLNRAAEDVERGGPVGDLLEGHEADPVESMLGLRMMAAVHRLVLEGSAPELARFYPSVGGTPAAGRTWDSFRKIVEEERKRLRKLVEQPCQTNEVGRSAGLLGGFLLVAGETDLPLRLLEIGASAGLNLWFDHYFYSAEDESFGDAGSPVRFEDVFAEGRPPLEQTTAIASRQGCDPKALDPRSEDDRLKLVAAVWADQTERVAQLRAALELVASKPLQIDRAEAGAWLEGKLAEPSQGVATVVFHSIVWQYLSEPEQKRVCGAIEGAGARAGRNAPLAWLRMERGGELADVRLTTWPGGQESLIARAGYHGRPVLWLGR